MVQLVRMQLTSLLLFHELVHVVRLDVTQETDIVFCVVATHL